MNLTGGPSANEGNTGVSSAYDFGVVYSTKRVEGEEGERGERPERDGQRGDNQEQRRARKPRDHGTEFGKEKKADSDDDDFLIVRDTTKRVKKAYVAGSDSDEEDNSFRGRGGFRGGERGSRVSRGGERGSDRGRGGFFKNSAKRAE